MADNVNDKGDSRTIQEIETYLVTSAENSVSEHPRSPYKARIRRARVFGTRDSATPTPPPAVTKNLATALKMFRGSYAILF